MGRKEDRQDTLLGGDRVVMGRTLNPKT